MKNKNFEFATVIPVEIASLVKITNDITLDFLDDSPVIPAGSNFEIIDAWSSVIENHPGNLMEATALYVMISRCCHRELFCWEDSNPLGFMNSAEYEEYEYKDDVSTFIGIPMEWWLDNMLSSEERESSKGIEVLKFGEVIREKVFNNPYYKDEIDYAPLDIPFWAEEVGKGTEMSLRQCVDFLMGERGADGEVVLVTDINYVITRNTNRKRFDIWYLNNSEAEVYTYFNTLDQAKEYLLKEITEN